MSFSSQLTRRGKFNLIFLFIVFPVLGVITIFVLLNLNSWLAARPSIPVTFDTISSHEGDRVSIDGRFSLALGVVIQPNRACGVGTGDNLEFVPWDTSNDDITVYVPLGITYTSEPNHFYVPYNYTYNDFKIYTNEGQELGYRDVIRVIGTVRDVWQEDGSTTVYLCPSKIEAGD